MHTGQSDKKTPIFKSITEFIELDIISKTNNKYIYSTARHWYMVGALPFSHPEKQILKLDFSYSLIILKRNLQNPPVISQ